MYLKLLKCLYLSIFIVLGFSACKYTPKYKVGDCIFSKSSTGNSELDTYYKIVGMSEEKYTFKTCHAPDLRGISYDEHSKAVDECFRNYIFDMEFKTFDESKTQDGVSHPGMPIQCSEIN